MKPILLCLFFCCTTNLVLAQPANDDPCNAISIPVGVPDFTGQPCVPTTSYSWTAATITTATPNPTCVTTGFSNIKDVWYSLVVPSSGNLRVVVNNNLPLILAFYKTTNCASTLTYTEIACNTYTAIGTNVSIPLSGQTVGSTLYLRIMRTLEMPNPTGSALICATEIIPTPTIDNSKRVGIGTNNPLAKLDVVGTAIVRDSLQVGGNIESKQTLIGKNFQMTSNPGAGKIMVSDAQGNGSWAAKDSTFSSSWIISPFASRDTTIDGTCLKIRHLLAPEITAAVLAKKHVTVYFRVGSIGQYQLPYISDAGGATNQINCIFPTAGVILIYRHTYNTCRFTSAVAEAYPGQPVLINLPSSLEYRYVID